MTVTQAYTDPTGIDNVLQIPPTSFVIYPAKEPVRAQPVQDFLQTAVQLINVVHTFEGLPSKPFNNGGAVTFKDYIKGVVALTTYPAIYKTFTGDGVNFETPRVYPPIYLPTVR